MENTYRILVGKPEGKEDNINTDLKRQNSDNEG
jgi:hypothetical protein